MNKYLNKYPVMLLGSSLFFIPAFAWQETSQQLQHAFYSIPYQAKFLLGIHGVTGSSLFGISYGLQKAWYGHVQVQSLYSESGAVWTMGGGYRQCLNPRWVIGSHLHVDHGKLPDEYGRYTKLSLGLEARTLRYHLACNLYTPSVLGYGNRALDKKQLSKEEYRGHQAYCLKYIEQDQWGFDLQGSVRCFNNIQYNGGIYGKLQTTQSSIIGVMSCFEYVVNGYLSGVLKYTVDIFHGHHLTGGIQLQHQKMPRTSFKPELLWGSVLRHAASIRMSNEYIKKDECHFFFKSTAQSIENTATYENPSTRLNQSILDQLRNTYPTQTKKTTLHLSGCFDLSTNHKSHLLLQSNESIEGEFCESNQKDALRQLIQSMDVDLSTVNASLQSIGHETKLFDGRALIIGTVVPNHHSRLLQLGFFIPAYQLKNGNATHLTAPIFINPDKNKRIQDVSLQNIAISSLLDHKIPFKNTIGINISCCDQLLLDSIWINNVETGILLEDITQKNTNAPQDYPFQSIYIGETCYSNDPKVIEKLKKDIGRVAQKVMSDEDSNEIKRCNTWINNSHVLIGIHLKNGNSIQSLDKGLFRIFGKMNPLKPNKSTDSHQKSLTDLRIRDSMIVGQGVAVAIESGFHATFGCCLLGSHQIGCYVKDAALNWVGNANSKESTIYIDDVIPLKNTQNAIEALPLVKIAKKKHTNNFPTVCCVDIKKDNPLRLRTLFVNTDIVMVNANSDMRSQYFNYLKGGEPICDNNTSLRLIRPQHSLGSVQSAAQPSVEQEKYQDGTLSDTQSSLNSNSISEVPRHRRTPSLPSKVFSSNSLGIYPPGQQAAGFQKESLPSSKTTRKFTGERMQPLRLQTTHPIPLARRNSAPSASPHSPQAPKKPLGKFTVSSQALPTSQWKNNEDNTSIITIKQIFDELSKNGNDFNALPSNMKNIYRKFMQKQSGV